MIGYYITYCIFQLQFQYQNNFINQNFGITKFDLPSINCGPIRRPIPVQGINFTSQVIN